MQDRERATAALRYGFEELQSPRVYAAAHIENRASNRVLEHIGMKRQAQFSDNGGELHMHRLDQPE